MAFFWFLIALILFVVVISRKKDTSTDEYAQGFWDGYRSFGEELQKLLDRNAVDRQALQKLIRMGNDGEASPVQATHADAPLEPTALPEPAMAVQVPAAQPVVMQPVLTPQQQAARSLRNLNTILYMASFLLVAAGALFVAASMPDVVKLVGVWLIIIAFYGAGFILYVTVRRLRPAALAFLGTGMALIPFGGVALGQYTHLGPEPSWLITSCIGLGAYVLAAIRLRSQLVSYLTMASVLSLAGSAAATVQSGLMGEFVVLIIVSLLANFIATLRPHWVPAVFRRPIEQTGQVVTPIVLLASIVLIGRLSVSDYEAISLVALLHYVVAWAQVHSRRLEAVIRILASIVALIFVYDFSHAIAVVAFAALLVTSLQQAYSLMMSALVARRSAEAQWVGCLFIVQVLTFIFWQQSEYAATYNVIGMVLIGVVSLAAALRLRVIWPAVIGLVASIIVPILIARQLFVPSLPWWLVAVSYTLLAMAAVGGYLRMQRHSAAVRAFMITAEGVYLGLACIMAIADGHAVTALLVFGAAAIIIHATSHFVRQVWVQTIAAFLLLIATAYISAWLHVAGLWSIVFTGGVTAAILWAVAGVYALCGSLRRTTYSFASAQTALTIVSLATVGGVELINRWVVAIFVLAIIATVFIRSRVLVPRSALAIVATISYIGYFVLAVGAASNISTGWAVSLWVFGVALFSVASYIERQPAIQLLATLCAVPALSLITSLIYVPAAWSVLFVAGATALIHYAAACLHAAFSQANRQFMMTIVGQVALFATSLGLVYHDVVAMRVTTVVLLAAAAVSFAARWWNRDRSVRYSLLFMVSYIALYGIGLLASLQLGLGWGVAGLGVGAVLTLGASYVERQPQLQLLATLCVLFALSFVASLIHIPAAWSVLFVAGITAFIHYAAVGFHAALAQTDRQFMTITVAQAAIFTTCFGLVYGDVFVARTTTALLLGFAAVSFAIRWWSRGRSTRYSLLFAVSYIALYSVGLLASLQLSLGWGVLALGLGAAIFWSASYAERQPQLLIIGNILLALTVLRLWLWAGFDLTWFVIGCSWIITGIFYLGYGIFIGRGDRLREQLMLWSTWTVFGLGGFIALTTQGLSTAAALLLLGLATTLGVEAYRRKSWPLGESAVYLANFAAQRLFASLYPELNSVFYAHWWALIVACIALVRRQGVRPRLIVAMAFVSVSSGIYALGQGGGYQLLFLAEHLALLVIGALRQKTWAIWWGIAASSLAILYFLRSYTFLWLGFLGLLLIGIVVWRLMRTSQR
jgi:hypothetical protein